MTLEERVVQLEKEVVELKRETSTQPQLRFQSDEKLVSVTVRTDKRIFEIEAD